MDPRNNLSDPKAPIKATCHCGDITVTAPGHPKEPINQCHCTICRRYGVEWAYYKTDEVKVEIKDGASMGKYIWGFKWCSFEWCNGCGCLMYWWPNTSNGSGNMGLNSRMMEPDALRGVNKLVSYEDLFTPLPGEEGAHPVNPKCN